MSVLALSDWSVYYTWSALSNNNSRLLSNE